MSLTERYELLDLIAENETRSYLARERATVRMVMVHQLLPGPNRIGLLEMILRTRMIPASAGRLQIVELGEHEGMPFVVTEIIPGFGTLREWLQAELTHPVRPEVKDAGARAGSWPAPAEAPPAPARDPGEFTQLFRAVVPDIRQAAPQPPHPEPAPGPAPSPPPPAFTPPQPGSEPGEFTRMFQSGWQQPGAPSAAAAGTPPAAPVSQPDEFSRLFQQGFPVSTPPPAPASPPPPTGAPPPPIGVSEPGEFTRMFQSPLAPSPLEAQAPAGPPAPPAIPVPQAPPQQAWGIPPATGLSGGPAPPPPGGEFTRIFGSPPAAGQAAPPPSFAGPTAGGATQLFSSSAAAPPPPVPAPEAGPGDFTRMVAAPASEPTAAQPLASAPVSQPATARPTGSPYLPLYLILGSVFLIVLLLVLYFVLRR